MPMPPAPATADDASYIGADALRFDTKCAGIAIDLATADKFIHFDVLQTSDSDSNSDDGHLWHKLLTIRIADR